MIPALRPLLRALAVASVGFGAPLATVHAASPPAPRLAWETGPGFQRLALPPSPASEPTAGFTRLAPATLGVTFTNRCSAVRYAKRQNLMNGAGVALGDYDGDGWCDLYFCHREGANALYRNLGDWHFTNVTEQAGVAATNLISSGALFADLNGDGHLDLHVTSFLGPDALFLNQGDGTFAPAPNVGGLATPGGATSSAAADLDGDGDLDLYVARFAAESLLRDGSVIATRMVGGQPVATGRAGRRIRILNNKLYEYGEPDFLFLNEGQARFTAVNWSQRFLDESGRALPEAPPDLGFAVQLRDINADGHPDIYVCNDFQTPDRIWLNDGHGSFRALSHRALRNMSYASMGVDFADIDRDGNLDFYTVEMLPADQYRHMTHVVRGADPDLRSPRNPELRDAFSRSILSWNRGDGTYAEIAWYAGVATSDWSWTPAFLDVDLDGYEDLLVSSGYPHDVNDLDLSGGAGRGDGRRLNEAFTDELLRYPPLDSPQIAWRNRGNLHFEDASARWNFNYRVVTHGLAFADLDNDGDLDAVGSTFNAAPLLCRNDATAPRLAVRLRGKAPNTGGTGARVRLLGGPVPVQEQEMLTGGRYLSCDQGQRTFAATTSNTTLTLEVRWRDGSLSRIPHAVPNSIYVVDAASATPPPSDAPTAASATPPQPPLFQALTTPGLAPHVDPPFDEFARQPLLPWRLAFQGPGIAALDANQDGHDELLVADGRGGNLRQLQFPSGTPPSPPSAVLLDPPLPDDALAVLGLTLAPGHYALYASLSHYESGDTNAPSALRWDHQNGAWSRGTPLPAIPASPGPLAAADLDDDGDLDLVVAGRVLPGRYPQPASTCVFTNLAGVLALDATASAPFQRIGNVTGLLLTDLDGDTRPECVLACEWGGLRVFGRRQSTWIERTRALGLEDLTGIWQGLAAADFDGDGRLDLVAANWGRNSHQQRAPRGPWRLYHGDYGAGRTAILESFHHPGPGYDDFVPVRTRDPLAADFPWLTAAFPTHAAFAKAAVPQLLGEHAAATSFVEARTLDSLVLLNRGDHFQRLELPAPAQWTPIFGFATADFDLDGDVDLLALQNLFSVREEEDRLDSGRGLLLRNDGKGNFSAAPRAESGIDVLGEQRGAAITDINADGRPDLALTVNSGPLLLWTNQSPIPGLSARVRGPASNPTAIGAVLRVIRDTTPGPAHEIRAGSGRYSQDSATVFLGPAPGAQRVEVRFAGQPARAFPVPTGATHLVVDLRTP